MGRSMRAFKKGKNAVKVGLPSKKRVIAKASQLATYASHGYVANPNVLGARDRIAHAVQSTSLQTHQNEADEQFGSDDESDGLPILVLDTVGKHPSVKMAAGDSRFSSFFGPWWGSEKVRSALNKLRKDGKKAPLQRLTKMQRVHIGRLIAKHGDNYQGMSRDIKLNEMQHPEAVLRKLCTQYKCYEKVAREKLSEDMTT